MGSREPINVRAGVQYDMHLQGSRFILVEFMLAMILETGLLLLSINFGFRTTVQPWWYWLWLVLCVGLILNSVTIWLVARQIEQKEGARPPQPDGVPLERTIWMFSLLVILPAALPLLAWRQRNQGGV